MNSHYKSRPFHRLCVIATNLLSKFMSVGRRYTYTRTRRNDFTDCRSEHNVVCVGLRKNAGTLVLTKLCAL